MQRMAVGMFVQHASRALDCDVTAAAAHAAAAVATTRHRQIQI